MLSFIIPYAFTNQIYGTSARKNIIDNMHIRQIVDPSNFFIFESAVVKNIILVLGKTDDKTDIIIYKTEEDFITGTKTSFSISQQNFLKLKDYRLETKRLDRKLDILFCKRAGLITSQMNITMQCFQNFLKMRN